MTFQTGPWMIGPAADPAPTLPFELRVVQAPDHPDTDDRVMYFRGDVVVAGVTVWWEWQAVSRDVMASMRQDWWEGEIRERVAVAFALRLRAVLDVSD